MLYMHWLPNCMRPNSRHVPPFPIVQQGQQQQHARRGGGRTTQEQTDEGREGTGAGGRAEVEGRWNQTKPTRPTRDQQLSLRVSVREPSQSVCLGAEELIKSCVVVLLQAEQAPSSAKCRAVPCLAAVAAMPDECECDCDYVVVAVEPSPICESCMKSRGVQKRQQLEQLRRQEQQHHLGKRSEPRAEQRVPEPGPDRDLQHKEEEEENAEFLNGRREYVRYLEC